MEKIRNNPPKEIADMNLLYDDTTKEDLISYIIYLSVDPEGDYIDSVENHKPISDKALKNKKEILEKIKKK